MVGPTGGVTLLCLGTVTVGVNWSLNVTRSLHMLKIEVGVESCCDGSLTLERNSPSANLQT